jgi:transposase
MEDLEVIRVSQWAEIRHMHIALAIPKKQIARRLGLNIKTVRRALEKPQAPLVRLSPKRASKLDPYRDFICARLKEDPKLTAKRLWTLLKPKFHNLGVRTVCRYLAPIRAELYPKDVFVHRTYLPGETMEVDFGEAKVLLNGQLQKVKFLVVVLPASNVYFAKAYQVERLECLLDGLNAAFVYFGGLPKRLVLDNTSLAVKKVLKGTERIETRLFEAFRGSFPLHVDFCAPGKGWEKGSVERGVRYVRDNCFRPLPVVDSLQELNASILKVLEEDVSNRRLRDNTLIKEAFVNERSKLFPLPTFMPESCRILTAVCDKHAHVRIDNNSYSVPFQLARKPVTVKLYSDRITIALGGEIVADHKRSFKKGEFILDPFHILGLLEKKSRAAFEATAIRQWALPQVFYELREQLQRKTRKANREWIRVLMLLKEHSLEEMEILISIALAQGSPRLATIQALLRNRQEIPRKFAPAKISSQKCSELTVATPDLRKYDELGGL